MITNTCAGRPGMHIQQALAARTMVVRSAQGGERARLWEHIVRQRPVAADGR